MINTGKVRYLHDIEHHLELIYCDNSSISYPLHNHISVFTAGVVLDGSILLNTGQTVHSYGKNQIFLIPPYIPHSIMASDTYSLLSLCIHKNLLHYSKDDFDRIIFDTANLFISALNSDKIDQLLLCRLFRYFYSFKDDFSDTLDNADDPCIDRLKRELELFPECRLNIEEMAHAALINKYYFIRRFKQTAGLTPHQFQLQNRIRKAQRLISDSGTLTEVALATGFCDQSHFIRQFKKYVGLTPSDYKSSVGILKFQGVPQQSAGINFANR